jgi:hypothetical protein
MNRISEHRKILRRLGVLGVAAVCVTGVTLRLAPGAFSASTSQSTTAIPTSAISQLTTIAKGIATANGDPDPASVQAVATTHGQALSVATPGDWMPQETGDPVYLVVMSGTFTGTGFSSPAGHSTPTGGCSTRD